MKKKGSLGYFLELAKKDGFDNIIDWNRWRIKNNKMPNYTNIDRKKKEDFYKKHMFADRSDYEDSLAVSRGYNDNSDYRKELYWNSGISSPCSENEDCPSYQGVYIGEGIARPILIEIFGGIDERTHYGYSGYEYVVKGGYKIDVKSPTLHLGRNCWDFAINYNRYADYFLLIPFYNRDAIIPAYIWLIGKNEIIKGEKFYKRKTITITDIHKSLVLFKRYEWINKLKCIKEIEELCKKLKND